MGVSHGLPVIIPLPSASGRTSGAGRPRGGLNLGIFQKARPVGQSLHQRGYLLDQPFIDEIAVGVKSRRKGVGKEFRLVQQKQIQIYAGLGASWYWLRAVPMPPPAPSRQAGLPLSGARSGSRDSQSSAFFRAGAME